MGYDPKKDPQNDPLTWDTTEEEWVDIDIDANREAFDLSEAARVRGLDAHSAAIITAFENYDAMVDEDADRGDR